MSTKIFCVNAFAISLVLTFAVHFSPVKFLMMPYNLILLSYI